LPVAGSNVRFEKISRRMPPEGVCGDDPRVGPTSRQRWYRFILSCQDAYAYAALHFGFPVKLLKTSQLSNCASHFLYIKSFPYARRRRIAVCLKGNGSGESGGVARPSFDFRRPPTDRRLEGSSGSPDIALY
jgi:hypothetical protein